MSEKVPKERHSHTSSASPASSLGKTIRSRLHLSHASAPFSVPVWTSGPAWSSTLGFLFAGPRVWCLVELLRRGNGRSRGLNRHKQHDDTWTVPEAGFKPRYVFFSFSFSFSSSDVINFISPHRSTICLFYCHVWLHIDRLSFFGKMRIRNSEKRSK